MMSHHSTIFQKLNNNHSIEHGDSVPRYFYNLGRRLAIVAGSSVLGGVSERISQTRKTRR
jgi:hypothetical protein